MLVEQYILVMTTNIFSRYVHLKEIRLVEFILTTKIQDRLTKFMGIMFLWKEIDYKVKLLRSFTRAISSGLMIHRAQVRSTA